VKSDLTRWASAAFCVVLGFWRVVDYRQRVWHRGQTRPLPDWASKAINIGFGLVAITLGILIGTIGK